MWDFIFRKKACEQQETAPQKESLSKPVMTEKDIYCPVYKPYLESLSIDDVLARYEVFVKDLAEALPLEASEFRRLVYPIIVNVVRYIHLLPASEAHHHAFEGGLLVHVLESAQKASESVSPMKLVQIEGTFQEQYENRPRWQVAAAIMMLIHDVGKCTDMEVIGVNGEVWKAEHGALLDWINGRGCSSYQVLWHPNRVHKAHEVASLRLAYRALIPVETIKYLSEYSSLVVNAMDEAIVLSTGPLAEVLKTAEAYSIGRCLSMTKRCKFLRQSAR